MKKQGWKLSLLILLAAILFIWLIKTPIMSAYLTRKLQVPVSISNISMWPSQTTIRNFKVNNPHGFKTRAAFKVERTEIDYHFKRLIGTVSEIDQIRMDKVYLSIECSNPLCSSNNWTAIGSKMPEKKEEKTHGVLIHNLVLTNLSVEIRGLGLIGAPTVKYFDRMEFNEIDSRTGFPTKELIHKIFEGAGLQQYIQNLFNINPANAIQKALSPLKKFGSQNEEPASEKEAGVS